MSRLDSLPSDDARQWLRRAVEATVGARFVGGNKVTVLKNGVEIFPGILGALSSARRSIDFLTFIYWTGEIAQRVADALAERSRAGVRVRLLLDAFGCAPMRKSLLRRMSSAGVAIEHFRPVARWKFWESDHRTHRKIIVVDDQIAFTGGVGIASEWEGDARGPDEWRETHFRLDGPVALDLKAAFLADWRDTGHPIGRSDIPGDRVKKAGDIDIAVIDGSAQIGFDDSERVLEALIAAASSRILLQTPYFNPTSAILELLEKAAGRGVEIEMLVPGPHMDHRVSAVMAEDLYLPLLKTGMKVWIYQPTMMHTKALLVDGVVSMVGSINVNRRSVQKDEEVAVAILDEEVTSTLERHFREDVGRSLPAEPRDRSRPLHRRLLAKLLKPVKTEL